MALFVMHKVKKILFLGAFGYDTNHLDGQTVKTRNVYRLLQENYPGDLFRVDTMHIRRKPLSIFKLFWYLFRCKTLIIIPCLNNLTYIFPFLYFLSKILRYDIIHICIGGWQVEYFKGNERFNAHMLQMKLSKKIKVFMPEMIKIYKPKDIDWMGMICSLSFLLEITTDSLLTSNRVP